MTGRIETMESIPISLPDSEAMIAGKTKDEILSMNRWKRYRWYKILLPEEKDEAMEVVETARRTKISAAMCGEKHPAYGKTFTHTEATKAKISRAKMGKPRSEETCAKMSAARIGKYTGENHPNWRGGISFEPYGMEFNSELKRRIRKRDDYTCQECHLTEEQLGRALDVHHIDYDKKNNNLENLISLCRPCHSQTNFSREDWTEYFRTHVPSFSEIRGRE